jgi:splicing factor 3B subunit 2
LETPDFIDLRKKPSGIQTDESSAGPRELYTVIPERETTAKGFMGSSTAYDMSNVGKKGSVGSGAAVLGAEDRGNKVCVFTC